MLKGCISIPRCTLVTLSTVSCLTMDLCKLAFLLGALTCTASGTEVDGYTKIKGAQILSLERKHYSVNTVAECAAKCDAETSFTCRSFTYDQRDDECWTAPDNSKTLMVERGNSTVLYERKVYILECAFDTGARYRGTKATTKTGKTCQRWAETSVYTHNITPQDYPRAHLESNFCRNPDGAKEGPWCYTTDPHTHWEYCDVEKCTDECMHCAGEDYRGKISITENMYTCQRWDSQKPHSHLYYPTIFPDKDLVENFCRNPDGSPRPWCFTTDPSKRWDYCTIPLCTSNHSTIASELTCAIGNGENYRGKLDMTETGKKCQSWSAQTPHQHTRVPGNYPCKGLEKNYCRNPDNGDRPWCYTTDKETRWQYCKVPSCGDTGEQWTDHEEEDCYEGDGSSYRGMTSETVSGKKCQDWSAMSPHKHSDTPQNYPKADLRMNLCRNPGEDQAPWCYTTDPSVRWEYCNLEHCPTTTPTTTPNPQHPSPATPPRKDCKTVNGETYRGPTSITAKGVTCQAWSAQSPHQHKGFTPETHPDKGLEGNSCRNPDNDSGGPWCYTTNNDTRWDYCLIPNCVESKCGTPVFKPKRCFGRIVGGCVSKPNSWPWQISLQTTDGFHFCGGSLIDHQWVLTAEHCLRDAEDPSYYKVLLGVHTLSDDEPIRQERNVEKLIREPNGADIALLKLQSPAIINDKVQPVCLPEKDYIVPTRTECYVTGWGRTHGTGGAGVLKETGVPVIENKKCNSPSYMNGLVKDHEMCAGINEGGMDSCQGDSGGPLVCNSQSTYILQGVVSWGIGCATPMRPGIYVRVSKFVDWIDKTIEDD